jgi:hypothetical protein
MRCCAVRLPPHCVRADMRAPKKQTEQQTIFLFCVSAGKISKNEETHCRVI